MSNAPSSLQTALDRRAGETVGEPPVADLLARAHRRHRGRQAALVTLTAAVTAAVVVAGVAIADRGTPTRHRPAASSRPLTGISAQQVADGQWSPISKPPLLRCGGTLVSTGPTAVLLASDQGHTCPNTASVFDPRTNAWTQLAAPPAQLRSGNWQAVWNGSAVIVAANNGSVAELRPTADTWTALSPPTLIPGATVVADPQRTVVMGSMGHKVKALSYDGSHWSTLPDLAVPHGATPYLDGTTLWAFAIEGSGEHQVVRVYRLDANQWDAQPRPSHLPLSVDHVQRFGDRQLATGQNCPIGYLCTIGSADVDPVLIQLGSTHSTPLPAPPFVLGLDQALPVGQTITGISDGSGPVSQRRHFPAGTVTAYDPKTGQWLTTSHPPRIRQVYSAAWTAQGLIEIGPFSTSCHCTYGGAILRPAPSVSTNREAVAHAVLGKRFVLISAGPLQFGGSKQSGPSGDREQEWKAPNGDEANLTWQPDNATLDHAAPPTAHTASGNRYEIQH